ncbi:MAG TPA: hypothetical protein VGN13_01910 [Solirubrobacteraceae bacterium]|jgi:hypothetical protein
MAHISRPFQVALAAVGVLALVWVLALHRPSSGSSEVKSTARPVAAASASKTAGAAGGASAKGSSHGAAAGIYKGAAPGVEGLTRALAKAHAAVATSQQNAKQLQEKSEQASNAGTAPATTSVTPSSTRLAARATPAAKSAPAASPHRVAKPAPHRSASLPVLANQHLVEAELKHGKTVVLLFWSPNGSDDIAVKQALGKLARAQHGLAVHVTTPGQVASFGTITRGVQVYGTPTILVVAQHGRTVVLTGLQDSYAIQQAVTEARHT